MPNNSNNSVLTFQNTEFDIVDVHNIPWLVGHQIGGALGYQNTHKDIQKIYSRNADEFTEEMTQLVKLETAVGLRETRIFSPRGCYLIGMLAKTEKAKEFRHWVLDILEGRQLPRETRNLTAAQQIASHRLRIFLLKELKRETAEGMRNALFHQVDHISKLLSIPTPVLITIGREVKQLEVPGV